MTTAAHQQEEKMKTENMVVLHSRSRSNSSCFSSFLSLRRNALRTAAVSALLVTVFVFLDGANSRRNGEAMSLWSLTTAEAAEAPEIKETTEEKEEIEAGGSPAKLSSAKLAELLQMEAKDIEERMSALFDLIDVNKDEQIDQEEARQWSLKLKNAMHQHQVQMEFQAIDKNNDNKVSFDELAATYVSGADEKQVEEHKEEVRKRFKAVDKDGDNLLDFEEVMLLMDPGKDEILTQLEIDEILATQDKNKDKKITLQEFIETEGGSVTESEKQELQKEFDAYDLDHDGSIDAEELRKIIKDPHAHEIDTLLEEFMKEVPEGVVPKTRWVKDYEKFAVSMLTDNGEALRFPEDYQGIDFPYSSATSTGSEKDEAKEHDEL